MKILLRNINPALALIFLIPFLLILLWFKEGNIMGVAESGLPFYDFKISYESNKNAWAHYALGFPTNISISSKPSYWFLTVLQSIGIPGFFLQATFFWFVLVISGSSIYFMTRILYPGLSQKFLLLAVLFYWFNPFSMVNVWNRFLNNFFVFYILLPFSLLVFIKGFKSRQFIYAFFFGLASAVLAYALSSVAFNILLWLVLFYTAIFYFYIDKNPNSRIFVVKFFLIAVLFWTLVNFWWLSQAFSYVYSGSFSSVQQSSFPPDNNRLIFTILSQKLGNLIDILRFQHASFFSNDNEMPWVKLYLFPLTAFLSSLYFLIIFLPLIVKREKGPTLFLAGLLLLGVFLSTGNNSPLGGFVNLVFVKVGFLQVFRNAFEKFGFILPLAGSPLLAYGSFILYKGVYPRWQKYLYAFLVSWIILIFGLPYWTGLVFTSGETPANIPGIGYRVKVPEYYKAAADWLRGQKEDFRLLVFPLGGEGITYNWEKGFTGVELSNQILPVPSVSFQTNIPFYNDISSVLERTLLEKGDFTKVTNVLNAKYIMLRNDIDWHSRRMRDPQTIFNNLSKKSDQFKKVNNFGAMTFWENVNWTDRKIYTSNQIVTVSPQPKISDSQFFLGNTDVLMADSTGLSKISSSKEVIHPVTRLYLENIPDQSIEGGQNIFPHVKYSPTTKLYPLLLLKEEWDLNAITDISEKLDYIIMLLGKRLVEAKMAADLNNELGVLVTLEGYDKLLDKVTPLFSQYQLLKVDPNKQILRQEEFYIIFNKHKNLLQKLMTGFSGNKNIIDRLKQSQKLVDTKLIEGNIQPLFGFKENNNFPIRKRVAYKFNIINPGEYELLWGNTEFDKYYQTVSDGLTQIQIDDQILPVEVIPSYNILRSFGKRYFNSGIHEVSLNTPEGINLVDVPEEFTLKVVHGKEEKSFPIKNYDSYAEYTLSFDYWIKRGAGLEVWAVSNNGRINLGEKEPDFAEGIASDGYNFAEKHYYNSFKLNDGVDSVRLVFIVRPWNNCKSIYFSSQDKCRDDTFRRPYDRTTEVIIKNVSVIRNLVDEPILIKSNLTRSSVEPPKISYNKIDDTFYTLTIRDANNPFILVLSELFDPGWKLYTLEGTQINSPHFLANSYANGWEIERLGNYQLIIKFKPRDLLYFAERISQITFISGFSLVLLGLRKKYGKKD